jgi:hypothetical protein
MKLDTAKFIERARQVHGNLYDYSRTVYQRSTRKVEIICSIHGSFFQRPENHVNQKQHCPQCANQRKGKRERFSFEWMIERPERAYAPALLYVAEIQDKAGQRIEVGVTTKSMKQSDAKSKPKTTLLYLRYMSLKEALLLEDKIEKTLQEYALQPSGFFSGKTKRLQNLPTVHAALAEILPKN